MAMQLKDEQFFTCCAIGRDEKGVLYLRSYGTATSPPQMIRLKPSETLAIAEHTLLRAQQPDFKPKKSSILSTRTVKRRPMIVGFARPKVALIEHSHSTVPAVSPARVRVRRPVEQPSAPIERTRIRRPTETA